MHGTINSLSSWYDKYLITYLFLWLKYTSDYAEPRRKPLHLWFYNFPFRLKKIEEPLMMFCTQAHLRHLSNPLFGISLTLRLLKSYIYGAPSKARNANVVYIWTYVWQR